MEDELLKDMFKVMMVILSISFLILSGYALFYTNQKIDAIYLLLASYYFKSLIKTDKKEKNNAKL